MKFFKRFSFNHLCTRRGRERQQTPRKGCSRPSPTRTLTSVNNQCYQILDCPKTPITAIFQKAPQGRQIANSGNIEQPQLFTSVKSTFDES